MLTLRGWQGMLGPQAEASASSISAVLKGVFTFLDPSADGPDLGADIDPKVKRKKEKKKGVPLEKPSSTLAVPPGGEVDEKAVGEEDPNPKVDNEVVLYGKHYLSLEPTEAVPKEVDPKEKREGVLFGKDYLSLESTEAIPKEVDPKEKREGVLFGKDYSGIVPPGIKLEMAKRAKAKVENDIKETKEREEREAAEKRRARNDVLNYVLDTKEEKQKQMQQTLEMVSAPEP
jgi:hypothetical protein